MTAGYEVLPRFNAQGLLILKESFAYLPGGPLPGPLPGGGPLPASPFYIPANPAPLNPFMTPAFPFQTPSSLPAIDDDPYPNAYVDVGPLEPSWDW
ncbi:hypothetical protein J2739_001749 [Variovorax soli]|uniref:Uncharacterized protein n=1 Tax=Variovorax soli TaxID=376815 RepID=A0ABU1NC14_9BURK|nr:hypothetical protein [Variovorax soli]